MECIRIVWSEEQRSVSLVLLMIDLPSSSPQDLLRRDMLYYKGRMDMDHMEVLDVDDGKEKDFNMSVKNAIKLRSLAGDEVHLLCAKKPEHKQRWLRAFADERIQVQHDHDTGQIHDRLYRVFFCVAVVLIHELWADWICVTDMYVYFGIINVLVALIFL